MSYHGQHRHRHVPLGWRRCSDADEERRHGDVPRQGRRQERLPVLHQGDQDPVDRAPDAGIGPASRPRARSIRLALSAEGGSGHGANNRRRGAVALDPSRARCVAADAIYSARRGNRVDRPDRPLGLEGSLRAKRGLAAPRIAAGIDGGESIDEALAASGMSPVLLQLEVTESMVMRNVSRAVKVLAAIQNRGIRLAIDDFGTGYSSMSLMKQFPIDTIKIDRSFVRD